MIVRAFTTTTVFPGEMPLPMVNMSSDSLSFTAPIDNTYSIGAVIDGGSVQCAVTKNGELIGKGETVEAELQAGDTVTAQLFGLGNGDATAVFTIAYEDYEASDVMYRALLIGEVNFATVCKRNEGDVNTLRTLLSTVNGGKYAITKKIDLTKSGVQNAIASTFADADDNDVSLFFFTSHGIVLDKSTTSDYYGGMKTYDGSTIKTAELAQWLSAVPGKVIVLIGTCGGGGVIEEDTTIVEQAAAYDAQAEAVIEAFESADNGLTAEPELIRLPNGVLILANRGELRQSKFEVITAASGDENSWGVEGKTLERAYNFFMKWIKEGMLTSGSMPADTNADGSLTTNELYSYVADRAANYPIVVSEVTYYQHPQVYPENSDYVLFTR